MSAQSQQKQHVPGIAERLEHCATQFDVLRLLREITDIYGYRYFFVVNSQTTEAQSFSESIVITSAPSDMVQNHDASELISPNPVAAILRETGAPFEYRLDNLGSPAPAEFKVFAEGVSTEYDLDCWFIIPVYHPDHGPAAVCFLGKRSLMSASETAELTLHGHLLHNKLRQVSARPQKPDSPLTDRERECLIWTSLGKTSVEIAQILALSEHTVNHYLNNAARKFDAVNRTQAVAYGLRLGFIE